MKRMLCGFAVLTLLLALQSQAIAKKPPPPPPPPPDTYVVFYATGQFYSGYELSGTVTIDTTTGQAVSADLAVIGAGNSEVAVFNGTPSTYTNSEGDVEISVGYSTGIVLVMPTASLKGYAGGGLIADESHWWWPVYSFGYVGIDPLVYGSLEP